MSKFNLIVALFYLQESHKKKNETLNLLNKKKLPNKLQPF